MCPAVNYRPPLAMCLVLQFGDLDMQLIQLLLPVPTK